MGLIEAVYQMVSFDPTEMTLNQETIDLSNMQPEGLTPDTGRLETRGNRTFYGLSFNNVRTSTAPRIDGEIIVAVIDNENDELIDIIRDDRCGHMSGVAQTDNGDIYFLGDNGYNVLAAGTTCIVRIPADSEDFDDYLWEPASALGNQESNGLMALTNNKALVFALDRTRLDPTNPLSIIQDPVRKPWVIDLEAQTAVETDAPYTRAAQIYDVPGRRYFGLADSFDATAVYSFDEDTGEATLVTRTEGQLFNLVRFVE